MKRSLSPFFALALVALSATSSEGCKSNNIAVTNGPGVSDGGVRPQCHASPPTSKPGTTPMALMGLLDEKTCYWIDDTEVTNEQYEAFLADTSEKAQAPSCGENTSLSPDSSCTGDTTDAGPPASAAKQPATCVDWCDAWAYCKWAGKTLCQGGSASADARTSRWYAACSEGGAKTYPTQDGQSVGSCNAKSGGTLTAVGTSSCETSDGVQDLAGNAAEWVDECDSSGACNVRGGSVQSNADQASCKGVIALKRLPPDPSVLAYVGFRCCADAPAGSAVVADQ